MKTRAIRLAERREELRRQGTIAPSSDPSYRRKLAWAAAHISDAEALISDWHRDSYRLIFERDGKWGLTVFAEMLKALPDDLPLVVGDVLHNLWDSLDHLIFAISRKNPALTSADEDGPQFPVSRKGVAITINNPGIKFLSKPAATEVVALAPDPARQPLDKDPIWLLNKTNNRDKHREIAFKPVTLPTSGVGVTYASGPGSIQSFPEQPITLGSRVPVFRSTLPDLHADVSPFAKILFDKGVVVEDWEVIPTLRWFHDHIRDVVFARLEPYL